MAVTGYLTHLVGSKIDNVSVADDIHRMLGSLVIEEVRVLNLVIDLSLFV